MNVLNLELSIPFTTLRIMQKKLSSDCKYDKTEPYICSKKMKQMQKKQYDVNINGIQLKIGRMVLVKNNVGHKI